MGTLPLLHQGHLGATTNSRELLQVLHLHPWHPFSGRIPSLGSEDPSILVHLVVLDVLLLPGLHHVLQQHLPPAGELEGEEDVIVD